MSGSSAVTQVSIVTMLAVPAGCDRLFNLEPVEHGPASDAARDDSVHDSIAVDSSDSVADARCGIDDPFDTLDAIWEPFIHPATLLGATGTLTMELAQSTTGNAYVGVNAPVDFVDRQVSIDVARVPSSVNGAEAALVVTLGDSQNLHIIFFDEGTLRFRTRKGNVVVSDSSVAFSPTTHRFWQIRHVMASDTIVFETSSDGTNWTSRDEYAAAFDVTKGYLGVMAGTYLSIASPGIFEVDHLRSDACLR